MIALKYACIILLVSAGLCHSADKAQPVVAPGTAQIGSADFWTSDFEAAKTRAAKEGKNLLLDFTGSDWCGWCIKLKKEVFSTPAFEAAAPKQFVLVELDFPKDKTKLSAATAAQNEKLGKEFGVRGYPSIFLADAQGRPYAQMGYEPGGPTNYLALLATWGKVRAVRDAAWAKAAQAAGTEKARLLAEGLAALDEELIATFYGAMIAEIKKLDPADASGIIKRSEFKAKLAELEQSLMLILRKKDADTAAGLKQVDAFLASTIPTGEDLQKVMLLKLNCYPASSVENVDAVIKLLEKIAAVDPTTPTGMRAAQIKVRAETIKKDLQEKKKGAATEPEKE